MNISQKLIVWDDEGQVNIEVVQSFCDKLGIILPRFYVDFITKHNEARIENNSFDYRDLNMKSGRNSDGITFIRFEEIMPHIELQKEVNKQADGRIKYMFEDGLIPFGDNGGGDFICFDYRKNRTTDNPPIVIWNHDMGLEHRVIFIANNFEEFVGMLYESEEAKEDRRNWKGW
jgi:hypothetical protein